MPVLENPKHERFAQALAAGKTAVDAYEVAGYRRNRGHAATLRKNPKLLKRVDEILETRGQIQGRGALAAIERVRLTKTAVMDMLMRTGAQERSIERRDPRDRVDRHRARHVRDENGQQALRREAPLSVTS